jgi:hypothetical protein
MQATVKSLVAARRLVFLNGGFSMSDEATPTYVDMLDNYATGHRSIAAEFGAAALPTIAWQIDPFGHSATQGVLSSPSAGFQGVMWGREPSDFKAACRPGRALERIWLPSPSLGAAAATFAATFFDGGYDFPPWNRCSLTGNASQCSHAQGVADATAFAATEIVDKRAPALRGNDVLLNMGTDWAYENAIMDAAYPAQGALFEYVDGVIDGLNADPAGRFRAFYSTAADYVAEKLTSNVTLPALVTDLFPYSNDVAGHQNWAGYFTSRPAFKGYVRECSAVQQSARQLQALAGGVAGVGPTNSLFTLERAMGVAQHHGAISGTSVQEVNDDYVSRLAAGRAAAFAGLAGSLAAISGYTGEVFTPCELANATLCAPLEAGAPTVVLAYNALGQTVPAAPVRLSAGLPPGILSWAVYDATGAAVTAQLVPPSPRGARYTTAPPSPRSGSASEERCPQRATPPSSSCRATRRAVLRPRTQAQSLRAQAPTLR